MLRLSVCLSALSHKNRCCKLLFQWIQTQATTCNEMPLCFVVAVECVWDFFFFFMASAHCQYLHEQKQLFDCLSFSESARLLSSLSDQIEQTSQEWRGDRQRAMREKAHLPLYLKWQMEMCQMIWREKNVDFSPQLFAEGEEKINAQFCLLHRDLNIT